MGEKGQSLLPRREEPLIPITNRSTPVLDRLRNGEGGVSKAVAKGVAESTLADGEEKKKVAEERASQFRSALADELGVPEESINNEVSDIFTSLFLLDEDDVVDVEEEDTEEE